MGEWQVVEALGRGGMGAVYRARAVGREHEVALKVLSGELDASRLARFAREGELTARLRHEGIVAVHAALEVQGRPCLVYELVEGRPLSEALGGLDRAARLDVLRRVAHAVAHAHALGVVHRDLKAENVVLDARGRPKVIDFGLGRAADLERLTRTHAVLGTLGHMAPEQLEGGEAVGAPADVWALGVMLFQALVDRSPFEAESLVALVEQLDAGLREGPRALDPSVGVDLDAVVRRALARRQEARYADAGELAHDLDRVLLRGEPALARLASRDRWPMRALLVMAIGAAGLGIAALGVAAVRAPAAGAGAPQPTSADPPAPPAPPLDPAPPAGPATPSGPTPTSTRGPRLDALRAAAERGDAAAMLELGQALRRGEGGAPELVAGEVWIRRAARAGHTDAARELAGLVALGACPGEPLAALAALDAMIDDPRAAYLAGRARRYGPAAVRDGRAAHASFNRAAMARDPPGMVAVARDLFFGRDGLMVDQREAIEWLERAAALEYGPALYELANLLNVGRGVARDPARARGLHVRARAALAEAAARHEAEPALELGDLLRKGLGGPRDLPGAARLLRAAVGAGAGPLADESLGSLLLEAPELAHDAGEAARALARAAEDGHAGAAWKLYGLHRDGRLPHDDARAWSALLLAAEGVPEAAQEMIARARADPAPVELRARLRGALEAGRELAAYPLFGLVDEGRGGPHDREEADRLLRRAAAAGLSMARFDLAFRLWEREEPAAIAEAVEHFRRMATEGATAGMHLLGVAREQGRGAPQDLGEAVRWYEHAFSRGNAWAGADLARMRHEGRGCVRDDDAALEALQRAVPGLEQALAAGDGTARAALVMAARIGREIGAAREDAALELRSLRRGARLDDADCLVELGLRLARGRGVARDEVEAARLLERAAAAGRADAAEALRALGREPRAADE